MADPDPSGIVDGTVTKSDVAPETPGVNASGLPIVPAHYYGLECEHARGGLGRVMVAYDRRLERQVAVKELLKDDVASDARFVREARLTARLQHPSIVPVYEAGQWPNGRPFYAMKLISGRTLKEMVAEKGSLDERLALLPNIIATAEAIAYAHNRGIIHRDIKPSNIVVGDFGETMVVDWGLAKDLHVATMDADSPAGPYRNSDSELTTAGTVMGTPSYMAPEQAAGKQVDERADVYSLGAILFHVLAGAAPYSGESAEAVLARVLDAPSVPLEAREPGVPKDLAAIVSKAMARSPQDRYASAKVFAEDLRRFQTGQLVGAHRYSRSLLLRRWLRQHRSSVAVAGVLLAVLTGSLTLTIGRILRERDRAERRSNDLILTQAESQLALDPTAALAWLKQYPTRAADQTSVHIIAADAFSRGIAQKVLSSGDKILLAAISPDGQQIVSGSDTGVLHWWPTPDGAPRILDFRTTTTSLLFSPDGRTLAAGGEYGRLAIWNLRDGTRRDLAGHNVRNVNRLLFSADGNVLVSGDAAGRICLWDLSRATACEALDFPDATIRLLLRADGTPLVFVAQGRNLAVWNTKPRQRRLVATHDAAVDFVATSAHGQIVYTRAGRRIYGWEVSSGRRIAELPARTDPIFMIASPDGRRCAYWYFDHSISVFDLATRTTQRFELPQQVRFAAFSPGGDQLAISMVGGALAIHDLGSGDSQLLLGHAGLISALDFSRDGRTLLSAGLEEGTIRLWPIRRRGRVLSGDGGMLVSLSFSPDGERLAAGSNNGIANVWNVRDGRSVRTIVHSDFVQTVAFSPDGHWLASASWDGTAKWTNLEDGRTGTLAHGVRVQRVVWIDNGKSLITASMDGTISRWTFPEGVRQVLGKDAGPVHTLTLAPDGRSVLTSSDDGTVRLWPLDGEPSRLLARHADAAYARLFSDGRTGASVSLDRTAKVWSIDGALSRNLPSSNVRLLSLAVSSDNRHIAAAGEDGGLALWTLPDGALQVLHGHQAKITNVAFSPDSSQVAATGYDHTTWVWSIDSGDTAALRGHEGNVLRVAYSPDSQLIATAGADSTVHLWSRAELPLVPTDAARFQQWLHDATNDVVPTATGRRAKR